MNPRMCHLADKSVNLVMLKAFVEGQRDVKALCVMLLYFFFLLSCTSNALL